jgi:enoyl-CoA hydratase/carnithine racemase
MDDRTVSTGDSGRAPRAEPGGAPGAPSDELVVVRRHGDGGHVAELVLNRTGAMNAVSTDMARAIADATNGLAGDDSVRVVVVSSSHPRAFCVGADLKERNSLTDEQLRDQRPVARAAYGGVLRLPVPSIAAVDGFALGGGLEIALSCDLIVAGSSALVGLPEVSVGVIPGGGGTQLVTRRVGWSRAARLIFTAEKMPASRAHGLGLVDELVEDGTARDHALALAHTIAANSPVGLRQAKRAMREGFDTDLSSGLDVEDAAWHATAFSGDRAEGVAAFAEKRPPRWPGR